MTAKRGANVFVLPGYFKFVCTALQMFGLKIVANSAASLIFCSSFAKAEE